MEIQKFEVGSRVCEPSPDMVVFELTDSGATLALKMGRPTAKEKREVKSGVAQFKFVVVNDILFFLCRFGTLEWMDAPFSIGLSGTSNLPHADEGLGLALYIMLIDASTGILNFQKLVGLQTEFTNNLISAMMKLPAIVEKRAYAQALESIYNKYSTMSLVEMATDTN